MKILAKHMDVFGFMALLALAFGGFYFAVALISFLITGSWTIFTSTGFWTYYTLQVSGWFWWVLLAAFVADILILGILLGMRIHFRLTHRPFGQASIKRSGL
jgi:hypothetical protein